MDRINFRDNGKRFRGALVQRGRGRVGQEKEGRPISSSAFLWFLCWVRDWVWIVFGFVPTPTPHDEHPVAPLANSHDTAQAPRRPTSA